MEWKDLIREEPGLAKLLEEVRAADKPGLPRFCGVTAWHGKGGQPGFKMKAYRLAGYGSSKAEFRTMDAYETAAETLYAALPPCRGCACVEQEELCDAWQRTTIHQLARV